MLARDMLIKEFEYNHWANGRILDQAANVSDEQWGEKKDAEGRSLQETLAHLVIVERIWRLLSAHGSLEKGALPDPASLATAAQLREMSDAENELVMVLLHDWSDEAFSEVEQVTRWDGQVSHMVRWTMLQHLLLHSMQHRSEAAMLLTEFGHSPGNIDLLFFL